MAWRAGAKGEAVQKPARCPEDIARALLESLPARELLPPVSTVTACPVAIEDDDGNLCNVVSASRQQSARICPSLLDGPPRWRGPHLAMAAYDVKGGTRAAGVTARFATNSSMVKELLVPRHPPEQEFAMQHTG